jgi:hypothetical protein
VVVVMASCIVNLAVILFYYCIKKLYYETPTSPTKHEATYSYVCSQERLDLGVGPVLCVNLIL